jgi:membrane-associated phospholipid phosphatase
VLRTTVNPAPATAAGLAAVSGALLVGLTVLVITAPSVPLDDALAGWPPEGRTAWLVDAMNAVRFVAAQAPFVLTAVVGLALWRHNRLVAALLAGNFAASMLVSIVLKVAVNRQRPGDGGAGLPIGTTDQASFPSSSVVACVAFWGFLGAVVAISGDRRWWQRLLLAGSLLLIVLIGPSRLYVGDHWLSDVVAGYLLSASTLGLSLGIWLRRRPPRPRRDAVAAP